MVKLIRNLGFIIAIIVLLFAILLLTLTVIGHIRYDSFFDQAREEFLIPGIHTGFIPQGLSYDEASQQFLVSGYMTDGSASRVYVVASDTGEGQQVLLKETDGSDCTGHVGGLTVYRDLVFFANGDHLLVYSMAEIIEAGEGGSVTALGKLPVACGAAFCYVEQETLFVGEFYRSGNYETDSSHHFTDSTGKTNRAVILCYPLSSDAELGVSSSAPERAYSITDLVQGMCITDRGDLCLSASWGPATSYLYIFDESDLKKVDASLFVDGCEIPVTFLNADNCKETLELAPMLEEIVYHDGRIYTLYESASNKYIFGKFFRETNVWSFARP